MLSGETGEQKKEAATVSSGVWSIAQSLRTLRATLSKIATSTLGNGEFAPAHHKIHLALTRIKDSKFFRPSDSAAAPYGYFMDRPIIGDGTAFLGGIYLSPTPAEAVVVDERFGTLPALAAEFSELYLAPQNSDVIESSVILEEVAHAVSSVFSVEGSVSNNVSEPAIGIDQKVSLDLYLQSGAGENRHKVLTAGYLVEKLIATKRISGTVGIDTSGDFEKLLFRTANNDVLLVDFEARRIERRQ